ncbi:hypothetical protein FHS42_007230 [Streptomyces zagrosensis]|uniref:Uncharacterized protein n=1 Tax=Streptomyces zagrosensis TaxID=1042984 RepID=A0A7W9QJG1_9ACTN|nr:hypothetical protein [Streptomyces zagrosensis]
MYRKGTGLFIMQGNVSEAFTAPTGEGLVEIPEPVLREAFRALGW